MKQLRLIWYEIARLLRRGFTWVVMAVITLTPIIFCTGMLGRIQINTGQGLETLSNTYILYPIFSSIIVAGFAAVILLVYDMQRVKRANMTAISDSLTNPVGRCIRQTAAVIALVALCFVLVLAALAPYTSYVMGIMFDASVFFQGWMYFYLMGIIVFLLFAAAFYMISNHLLLSLFFTAVLLIAHVIPNEDAGLAKYFLLIANTPVNLLSDGTGNALQLQVALYYRLAWLAFALTAFAFGILCVRRYGKNLAGSIWHSLRVAIVPVAMFCLFVVCVLFVVKEPFFARGANKDGSYIDSKIGLTISYIRAFVSGETSASVLITGGSVDAVIDDQRWILRAEAKLDIQKENPEEEYVYKFRLAPGLEVTEILQDGEPLSFVKSQYDEGTTCYYMKLRQGRESILTIRYQGRPKSSVYPEKTISKDYVDMSNWVPITEPSDSVQITLSLPDHLTPFFDAKDVERSASALSGYYDYQYDSKDSQMGAHDLFAGLYETVAYDVAGQEVQFSYFSRKRNLLEQSDIPEMIRDMLQFYAKRFGPLKDSWQMSIDPLIIAERSTSVPAFAMGTVYISETAFWGYDQQGRMDKADILNLQAIGRTIAGLFWTNVGAGTSQTWNKDDFSDFCAYLYFKHRMGEEYVQRGYVDQWHKNRNFLENTFYNIQSKYIDRLPKSVRTDIRSMLNYWGGKGHLQLMLLKAQEAAGGEEAFCEKLRGLREEYDSSKNQQISYDQFLDFMNLTQEDLSLG